MIHFNFPKNIIIIFSLALLFFTAGCKKTDLSSPGENITCYAAAYSKGVYKSENGGISWYPLVPEQEDICLYSKRLFMSPDNKRLYVTTTGNGLFYIDMEKSILNNVKKFKDEDIRSVLFRELSSAGGVGSDIIVASKGNGIYRNVSGKGDWQEINHGLTYRDLNVLFKNSGNVLAGTGKGIFQWDDAANAWHDSSEGIINKNIVAISSDPACNSIYAGTGGYHAKKGMFEDIPCLYKSTDRGRTWKASGDGLPEGTIVFSIAVNPARPERIYLGTDQGVYRSSDSGKSWSETSDGLPESFHVLDVKIVKIPNDKDLVFAAGANGLYMAVDDENQEWISRSYGLDKTYISSLLFVTQTGN